MRRSLNRGPTLGAKIGIQDDLDLILKIERRDRKLHSNIGHISENFRDVQHTMDLWTGNIPLPYFSYSFRCCSHLSMVILGAPITIPAE
jgi:hypothetical protein